MKFELDPLPYAADALAPHISADTVDVHYHKHHASYLRKLADEIGDRPMAKLPLDEIVRTARADTSLFRNAAQVWNHSFYWNCLAPGGGGRPDGRIAELIDRDFGSLEDFRQRFAEAATSQFGSGWAWLAANASGRLQILSTSDADNPMRDDMTPVLTLDVWEHAYYLDYRNERGKYVEACLDHLLNWRFAESNVEIAAVQNDRLVAEAGS